MQAQSRDAGSEWGSRLRAGMHREACLKPTFRAALQTSYKEEATKGKDRLRGRRDLITGVAQCDMSSWLFLHLPTGKIKGEFVSVFNEHRHGWDMFFSTSDGNSLAMMQTPGNWCGVFFVAFCFRNQLVPKNKSDFLYIYIFGPLEWITWCLEFDLDKIQLLVFEKKKKWKKKVLGNKSDIKHTSAKKIFPSKLCSL